MDMQKLAACIEEGTPWSEIGLPELYGNVTVSTTDPNEIQFRQYVCGPSGQYPLRRYGGREFSYGDPAQAADDFRNLGYMESSSSDLFDQFLKTGIGAKPIAAGYENQILEFAVEDPDTWSR